MKEKNKKNGALKGPEELMMRLIFGPLGKGLMMRLIFGPNVICWRAISGNLESKAIVNCKPEAVSLTLLLVGISS